MIENAASTDRVHSYSSNRSFLNAAERALIALGLDNFLNDPCMIMDFGGYRESVEPASFRGMKRKRAVRNGAKVEYYIELKDKVIDIVLDPGTGLVRTIMNYRSVDENLATG